MTVKLGDETDAFEDVIPVEVLASPETVAAYGEAAGTTASAKETLTIPAGVVPGFGGLHVEVASTALVGLGEGARYLVEYPYGCAEQKGVARARAAARRRPRRCLHAARHGHREDAPAVAADAEGSGAVPMRQRRLRLLAWRLPRTTSPYLTAYLLHVFKAAVGPEV